MPADQPAGDSADEKRGYPVAHRTASQKGKGSPIPEAWLGRGVDLVFVSGSSTEYADGVLEEVSDRGIVLSVEVHVGRPAQPLFYPWGAVIRLSEKQRG